MNSRLFGVLCACSISIANSPALYAAPVSGQGTWETTLEGRDLDGNLSTFEAYYDTVLDITWLADANYAGRRWNWASANSWAAALDPYGSGITGWRLPDANPIDGTTAYDANTSYIGTKDRGSNISAPGTLFAGSTANEMAHLFHNTLGNLGYCDPATSTVSSCSGPQTGWGLSNTGPFSNVQSELYWSGMLFGSGAWYFSMDRGVQSTSATRNGHYAWAVHEGDVGASAVPVPAAFWLFGSGPLGLIGLCRNEKPVGVKS